MADDLKLDVFDRLDRAEETLARFGYKWSEEQCQYVSVSNLVPSVAANNPTTLPGTVWVGETTPSESIACTCTPGCVSHQMGCPHWVLQL